MVFLWSDVSLRVSPKRARELMVRSSGNPKPVSWLCFANLETKHSVIDLSQIHFYNKIALKFHLYNN